MKKILKNSKKKIISITALLLVVLMLIGALTSCEKFKRIKYIEKVKAVTAMQEGSYELSFNLSEHEKQDKSKSTDIVNNEAVKVLLSGKMKTNNKNAFLTSNISLSLGNNNKYIDFTDIIFDEKGLYINISKLVDGLKVILNDDSFGKGLDNLKIPKNQYVFIEYEKIEEYSDLNDEDMNIITKAIDETFVNDLENFLINTQMVSQNGNKITATLNKENGQKVITELREYINEKFESTFDEFSSKIENVNSNEIKESIKELKQEIIQCSDELKDYEEDYEKKLEELNVNDFNYISEVSKENKTGKISFIANTNIDNTETKVNVDYTINEEKVDDNVFASPENIINFDDLENLLSLYPKEN